MNAMVNYHRLAGARTGIRMKTAGAGIAGILAMLTLTACRAHLHAGVRPPPAPAPAADAVAFAGHHYKAFEHDGSWHAARDKCVALGGHLACIETETEQAFIAKLADGRYLSLGATDEAQEDKWVWVNGARFDYTCWLDGQPNNYGGEENYLATYDGGQWVDVAAEGNAFWMPTGYICEWDR